MAVVRWEPFRELAALQNEMGRWMNQVVGGGALQPGNGQSETWLPAVDVWETERELVLSFDLPGIPEDKISVELDDDVLTVTGERERTQEHSDERFFRFERRFGTFSRSVTLPAGVNEGEIKADYKDGVLEVRVPKPEEQKPKKIQIGTGAQGTIEGTSTREES
ncbi:MAG: Hsp20/alpha crystallin family protein [Actinomycetota bacterium]|nr:Hsp20/alpha crystallin family protein [Actinomycetota bacterium]